MGSEDPTRNPIRGGNDPISDKRPSHRVSVDGFRMDRTEVTSRQGEEFPAAPAELKRVHRGKGEITTGANHLGFRVVRSGR